MLFSHLEETCDEVNAAKLFLSFVCCCFKIISTTPSPSPPPALLCVYALGTSKTLPQDAKV